MCKTGFTHILPLEDFPIIELSSFVLAEVDELQIKIACMPSPIRQA